MVGLKKLALSPEMTKKAQDAISLAQGMAEGAESSIEEAINDIENGIKIEKGKVRRIQIKEMRIGRKKAGDERSLKDAIEAVKETIVEINKHVAHAELLEGRKKWDSDKITVFRHLVIKNAKEIESTFNDADKAFREAEKDIEALKKKTDFEIAIEGLEAKTHEEAKKQLEAAKATLKYAKEKFGESLGKEGVA